MEKKNTSYDFRNHGYGVKGLAPYYNKTLDSDNAGIEMWNILIASPNGGEPFNRLHSEESSLGHGLELCSLWWSLVYYELSNTQIEYLYRISHSYQNRAAERSGNEIKPDIGEIIFEKIRLQMQYKLTRPYTDDIYKKIMTLDHEINMLYAEHWPKFMIATEKSLLDAEYELSNEQKECFAIAHKQI